MISDKNLDDLITDLAGYTLKFNSVIMLANKRISLIRDALNELKNRRESDIIPATKFLGFDLETLINKVTEECDEVTDACDDEMDLYLKEGRTENLRHLLEELTDVQFAAETAITKILPDINDRWAVRRQTRDKNDKRGYYEVPK